MLIYATITIDENYDVLKTEREEELTLYTNNMWRRDKRINSRWCNCNIEIILLLVAKEFFGQFALEKSI